MDNAPARQRFTDVWNGVWHTNDYKEWLEAAFSPSFQMHISSIPQGPLSLSDWGRFVKNWKTAFPDGRMEICDFIHQEESIWCRWVSTGTHRDQYLGVAATGKYVRYEGVDIYKMTGSNIMECWTVPDVLTLLRQLGVIEK